MLFLLDNNIDMAVAGVIAGARQRCCTARQVGLATATDEEVSIWGDEKKAIVITHDREFIQRRKRNTFGRHVWLECADDDAAEILAKHLPEIVTQLDGQDSIILHVTRTNVIRYAGRWT